MAIHFSPLKTALSIDYYIKTDLVEHVTCVIQHNVTSIQ